MEMTMEFFTLGINYQNTPVELREKFALNPNQVLGKLKGRSLISEAVYLTTCNRSEVYAVSDKGSRAFVGVQRELCVDAGIDFSSIEDIWYIKTGSEALTHLCRVASSLDAMVVGEAQILGQLKDAYFKARECGTTGPFIDRAMLHAIQIAKKIRTETNIGKGQVSVASVAVDLAVRHLNDLSNLTVLVVGAGEMGALVVRQLKNHCAGKILVANRTFEKAAMIAEHTGGEAIQWENLSCGLERSDIVIASTGSKKPGIGEEMLKNRSRPLVLIDLGTPRDISPQVAKIKNVHLFNIDDLKKIAKENGEKRIDEAKKAESLISRESERFFSQLSKPDYMTTVATLNQKLEAIGEQEVEKTLQRLSGLTDEQRETIKTGARSIIAKISYDPITELKGDDLNEIERQILSDALSRLFRLE